MAPSAPPLVILMTALLLAVGLILLGPCGSSIEQSGPSPWAPSGPTSSLGFTTDHKEVGIMYFLYGFLFFLVGGLLALLFRIQLSVPRTISSPTTRTTPFTLTARR
ncbi:MAG: hypothetical protein CM15mP128_1890 [Methanobacteriota archaeon]|nr:MAG: hypothetical protein CM15mP128_1890 [Euryarchaeota archaeon]